MARKGENGNFILIEEGTDKYAALDMAQALSLAAVAEAIATTFRTDSNHREKDQQGDKEQR